jgi:hypothetical protein
LAPALRDEGDVAAAEGELDVRLDVNLPTTKSSTTAAATTKGYSSTYAASGEEQIVHYLENRDTSRGYLVVFDARMDDFGKTLLGAPVSGKFTIGERFVDVRPRVKQKAAAKKKTSTRRE